MSEANRKAGKKGGKAHAKKYPKGASARGKITAARKAAGYKKKAKPRRQGK